MIVFLQKNPTHASDFESQTFSLQEDLRRTREQLASTEMQKRQLEQDVQEAREQLSILLSKYEDCQRQKLDLAASEDNRIRELLKLSKERDRVWQSELEALQKQRSLDAAALGSALKEVQRLKVHLSKVSKTESAYAEQSEIQESELLELKQEMDRTLSTVEKLKIQIRDSEQSKAKAEAMLRETQHQLHIAKNTIDTLLSDGAALMESFNSIVSELEKSRAQENLLAETVNKLQEDQLAASGSVTGRDCLELEVEDLSLAVEVRNLVLIQSAHEFEEQRRNESVLREADLQDVCIFGLKARLLAKEAQLRELSDMNERLHAEIREGMSQIKSTLGSKLLQSAEQISELKAKIKDTETELQGVWQENKLLKSKMKEREETVAEVELARAKEQEAVTKLVMATDELGRSSKRAAMLTEQLDASQAAKEEMESELKRLRVQLEQWKKAAEAAIGVLTTEKNESFVKLMNVPFSENLDDESAKARNNNMLRRMGEMWKKGRNNCDGHF